MIWSASTTTTNSQMSSSNTAKVNCTHTRLFLQNGPHTLQELFLANSQYLRTPTPPWDRLTFLQVVSSSTIDLGDEDDPEMIREMIKSMYLRDDTLSYLVFPSDNRSLASLVDMFVLADKYDVPQLRRMTSYAFEDKLSHDYSRNSDDFIRTIIPRVCGPTAIHFADKDLQRSTLKHCKLHFPDLLQDERFVRQYTDGSLFDDEFALAFNLHVGKSALESKGLITTLIEGFEKEINRSPTRLVTRSSTSTPYS